MNFWLDSTSISFLEAETILITGYVIALVLSCARSFTHSRSVFGIRLGQFFPEFAVNAACFVKFFWFRHNSYSLAGYQCNYQINKVQIASRKCNSFRMNRQIKKITPVRKSNRRKNCYEYLHRPVLPERQLKADPGSARHVIRTGIVQFSANFSVRGYP